MLRDVRLENLLFLQVDVDVATHINIKDDGPKRRFVSPSSFFTVELRGYAIYLGAQNKRSLVEKTDMAGNTAFS